MFPPMNSILSVKPEITSPGRWPLYMGEGEAPIPAAWCVKRRRRSSGPRNCDSVSQGVGLEQPQQLQVDGNNPAVNTVKRSSRFRGVSRHRWTGRFEAHLWDKSSWNPTQKKKGKQIYLGAYDEEESAAQAYDLAALKYWGTSTFTNFPISNYEKEIEIMKTLTREEYLASLRRRSSGFSRGVSKYRGVARHHHNGRWEARIGRVLGNKYLYLGTYSTQEEAARAYDIAAIEYRGINAVTNFELSSYIRWLRPGHAGFNSSQQPNSALAVLPRDETELPSFTSKPYESCATRNQDMKGPSLLSFAVNSSSSSPSLGALGLLFRSSVFKDLVERNPNTDAEEGCQDLAKTQVELKEADTFPGTALPFLCSSRHCPSRDHKGVDYPYIDVNQDQYEAGEKFSISTNNGNWITFYGS